MGLTCIQPAQLTVRFDDDKLVPAAVTHFHYVGSVLLQTVHLGAQAIRFALRNVGLCQRERGSQRRVEIRAINQAEK